ncbi:hypothetical protein [Qipengyuania oceanensis]|uniref:Uncharacterized protein n=1 Tax=Qipengyuania oceanensis TaxID=1463597 RepID=A0A844YFY9_9SPHN|nr:hypothetical protein [Qipengyuania oceanensis]MXO63430.1 hypothetical protein [Qipengyuania oceanensis]
MSKTQEVSAVEADERREPTEAEAVAIDAARERRSNRPVRVQYNERERDGGTVRLESPHSDDEGNADHLADVFATSSEPFVSRSLVHLANMTSDNGSGDGFAGSCEGLNRDLALIGAIQPQNELEAALAVQMASVHELSLELLRRARKAKTVEGMQAYGNQATKMTRTFAAQMKALSDWRRGGEQVVRHVHVYEGGQAIVAGTINAGGQKTGFTAFKPHEQHIEGPCGPEVLGYDARGYAMPATSDEGPEPVQSARRQDSGCGSTKGES